MKPAPFFWVYPFVFVQTKHAAMFFLHSQPPPNGRCVDSTGKILNSKAGRRLLTVERLGVEMTWGEGWYTPPREIILPYKPTFPSFLGVKRPIYWV